jgi:hypothetical protein
MIETMFLEASCSVLIFFDSFAEADSLPLKLLDDRKPFGDQPVIADPL